MPEQNLGYLENQATAPLMLDCETNRWRVDPPRQFGGWRPGTPEGCEDGATTSSNWQGTCRCPMPGEEDAMPLPNDGDDCRVLDEDNDKQPGIAVRTSWMGVTGDMYVASDREGFAEGDIDLTGSGLHTGGWHDRGSENTIFGCDESEIFFFGCPMPNAQPCNGPVNQMLFVPLGSSTNCDTISLRRDELFQDYAYAAEPTFSMCTCLDCD